MYIVVYLVTYRCLSSLFSLKLLDLFKLYLKKPYSLLHSVYISCYTYVGKDRKAYEVIMGTDGWGSRIGKVVGFWISAKGIS